MIVVAWRDMQGIEPTGRMEKFDGYNYRKEFRAAAMAHAVVWSCDVTAAEAEKARAWVDKEHLEADAIAVYVIPAAVEDPLAEARRRILSERGAVRSTEGATDA